jgi:hypothetical protein
LLAAALGPRRASAARQRGLSLAHRGTAAQKNRKDQRNRKDIDMKKLLLSTRASAVAIAAVLALAIPVAAQQQGQTGQQQQQGQGTDQSQKQSGHQAQGGAQGQGGQQTMNAQQAEALILTVGDTEIRGREVMEAIGALPPQLRQQPLDMLVPIALDQLVMQELILQEAKNANLQNDPEVRALADPAAQAAQERAMVQVWLQRQLQERVTDQQIQQVYDGIKAAQPNAAVPPLEQIKPMIEQQVRQQALTEIRNNLRQGADITFYGPSGQPTQPQDQQGAQTQGAGQGQQSQSGGQSQKGG